jgi:predicted small secreted protein
MKRFWTAMAVVLLAIFVVTGCNDYGNTFQNPTGAFLSFLSPSQVSAGSGQFTLTVNGSGFVKGTVVQWNGTTCPTSTTSGAPCTTTLTLDVNNNVISVTATISASLIAKPGIATVNTNNPGSSYGSGAGYNGLSNTITFIINNPPNPVPTVTSVSPTCATIGSNLALTVTGTNFLNTVNTSDPNQNNFSTLNWTLGSTQFQFTPISKTSPTTITSTQITATIPAADLGTVPGNAMVTVYNPPSLQVPNVPGSAGSGGGTSAPVVTVPIQSSCPVAGKAPATTILTADVAEETPAISLDGRYVAYTAVRDEHAQIFLRDTCEGAAASCQPHTSLLSVTSDGDPAAGDSHTPSMSSDGRYVAFSSDATNLVENAPPGRQVYLRDTCISADVSCKPSTILVSTDSGGALVGAESILPSISSSGRFVAFLAVTPSHSPNHPSAETKSSSGAAIAAPNSGYRQVFVRDTCLGAADCTPKTTRISLQPGDGTGTDVSPAGPALSGKAKHVAMTGAKSSTLFTRSVAVDDSIFLAITSDQH